MRNLSLLTIILLSVACVTIKSGKTTIYWINSYKVDCVGVGPMKCFLVQNNKSIEPGQWVNFYSNIKGFDYQPGYLYKLKIKEEKLENVPADASSVKYMLIEVLERKQDHKLKINDIWLATSLDGEDISMIGANGNDKNAQIEIHVAEMRIMGNDGCNNFTGNITNFDEGLLEFGPIAGTRMMCVDMTIPDKFNVALAKVRKYELVNLKLIFMDGSGNKLITFKKVD